MLELVAGCEYALFDLAGVPGDRKALTTASAWARTVAGKPAQLSLQAHAGGAAIGPEWARVAHTAVSLNGTGSVRILVPAGGVVRVALPQVEQLGWASSPVPTAARPATRAASVLAGGGT